MNKFEAVFTKLRSAGAGRSKYRERGTARHSILLLFMWLTLVVSATDVKANASTENVQEIVEVCMLSNRMLKDYALIGMGVVYQDPVADLQAGMVEMSMYMSTGSLDSYDLSEELGVSLRQLEAAWSEIEPTLITEPSKDDVSDLRNKVEKFTTHCEQVVEELAIDTQIPGQQELVLAGKLGMEVQRLAALYMIQAWGAKHDQYHSEVKRIQSQFKKNYQQLTSADSTGESEELRSLLKNVDNQFLVFGFLASSKSGRYQPTRAEKIAANVFYEVRDILLLAEELL